jgi:hypothetical protein
MKKAILLLFFLVSTVAAQDGPKPDRWRGLVLNEATSADAIAKLGKPKKDGMGAISADPVSHWLTEKRKQRIHRNLVFEKVEGVDRVFLSFLEDKLVMITIDLKDKIEPLAVANSYGISLEPVVLAMSEAFARPGEMERNQGKVYPKIFPAVYHLVGVSEKSFITAMVGNSSFGSVLGSSMGVGSQSGKLPGKVEFVTLVSRTLENRDGANALK